MVDLGGDKLKARLSEIARKLNNPATLKVGFLEGATYPDGTSVAEVAAYQEFGTPNAQFPIPPHPYFRTMVAKESGHWPDTLMHLLVAYDFDITRALDVMGQEIKGQLQQSIIDTLDPPLSQVTLMLRSMKAKNPSLKVSRRTVYEAIGRVKAGETAKGVSTKPLVDTSHMLNSVDFEVS